MFKFKDMVQAFNKCKHPEVKKIFIIIIFFIIINISFLISLYAEITYLPLRVSFKYSHLINYIQKVIVTKLKQKSKSAGTFVYFSSFFCIIIKSLGPHLTGIGESNLNLDSNLIRQGQKKSKSTSETLRDKSILSNTDKEVSVHVPIHSKPLSDNDFGHYLAGLIDGDGHFSKTPQLVIVFNQLDSSLAYYIKRRIGYGNIYKVKNKKAVILVVSKDEGIKKVIKLINGKIRSDNKLNQINKNILSNSRFINLPLFSKNNDNDLNNHWLTGFSDAIANFNIQLITKTNNSYPEGNKNPYPKDLPDTRIVVWGQNIYSSVGLGRFTKQVSHIIEIPAYQQSVITGLMLSDGWLSFGSKTSKSARLGFKQSLSHSGYFLFVFSFLSPYCNSMPNLISSNRNDTKTYALQILTRSLPCFTKLYSLYYPNGIKIVPADIYNLLTPIALAHWISGDGTKNRHGLTISTESFSVEDTVRLLNVLMIRYRLDCSLHKHSIGYNIYIKENSMPLLRTIVQPYMHNSMLYKLRIPLLKHSSQVTKDSKNKFLKQSSNDASFQIKLINRNQRTEVRLNFQIDQKENTLLILIKNFLGGNIGYRKSQDTYYYASTSFGSAVKVIHYFDQFHLLSSKYLNYLKWRKAYILMNKK